MNWLDGALQGPMVERVGWTLLHSLWQIAAVAVVLAGAMLALRRASANARYLVCCGAMLLMAVAPVVTFTILDTPPEPAPIAEPVEPMSLGPAESLPPAMVAPRTSVPPAGVSVATVELADASAPPPAEPARPPGLLAVIVLLATVRMLPGPPAGPGDVNTPPLK